MITGSVPEAVTAAVLRAAAAAQDACSLPFVSGMPGRVTDQLSIVAASFNERAPVYDGSVVHSDLARGVADFAALDGVRVVLDVATGTGLVLRAIAARGARVRLIGVDISTGMLEVARHELPAGEFVEGRAEQLPVRDATIDLVTCVTAMHLMADPGMVFAEIARALAPRGRLVLATFQPPHSNVNLPYRTNHAAFQTVDLVAAAATPAGFAVGRNATRRYGGHVCLLTELTG
jgi:ubiquinone/menaquinone biosynthesis C-methylase UbiE